MADAFTISSNNYLGMTSVFADSYLEHHPDDHVYVCLVDRPHPRVNYERYPFEILLAEDLNIPNFFNFAFKYDILELNTAVKPFVFKYLRDQKNCDRAFYFDPDILVHDRLGGLEEALKLHRAVLTPHLTKPLDNICRPPERVIGMCGIYNLGFVGLQLNEHTQTFLDWWCDRLYRYCINDLTNGMFVDQSWMDFAPAYLDSVAIMRDPIYNIAYWNLPHRKPELVEDHWEIGGRRVGFFHFSGVDPRDLDAVSKHQDRFDLFERPELRSLFEHYAELVKSSGHHKMRDIPYFFHHFRATDIPIPRFTRTALMEVDPEGRRWADPFDVEGDDSYLDWLIEICPFHSSVLHRAALFLWQQRQDLQAAFPTVFEGDVDGYLDWYLGGGGEEAGLHRVFVEGLGRARLEGRSPGFQNEMERFSSIDLAHPATEDVRWLNEKAEGAFDGFILNRGARLLHRERPDLAETYPVLDKAGRRGLIYWLCRYGREVCRIDERLLGPLYPQLPLKTRFKLRIEGFGVNSLNFESSSEKPVQTDLEEDRGVEKRTRSRDHVPPAGINILGCFEGERGGRSPARALVSAFERESYPVLGVSLDHELPGLMVSELIRYPSGLPFPESLLCEPPERWPEIVRHLPMSLRMCHRVIGYSLQKASMIPAPALAVVDMLWLPEEDLCDTRVGIPQRVVALPQFETPPISFPELRLPEDKIKIVAEGNWSEPAARSHLSILIDWVRNMPGEMAKHILLCLLMGPSGRLLKPEVEHLPVEVLCLPVGSALRRRILRECLAVIDLNSEPKFDFLRAEAVWQSVPVICREDCGMGSVLDAESAWILPKSDGSESSVSRDLSVLLQELIQGSEEARRRSGLARARAEVSWSFRVPRLSEEGEGE